jgi:phospholipase C
MRIMRCSIAALAAIVGLASCGGSASGPSSTAMVPQGVTASSAGTGSGVIKHVVILIQENRSFDDFFATFPGADGATEGLMKTPSGKDETVPLKEVNLVAPCDFGHSWLTYRKAWDNGKMDGFAQEGSGEKCHEKAGTAVYQYVNPEQIAPYWDIASQWVLVDHMFATQGSGSFTAHQDLIAGGTMINPDKTKSLVDFPSAKPWGCDDKDGALTTLLVWEQKELIREYNKGPFPCMSYATMRDLLDAKSVSWMYYSPKEPGGTGAIWNGFDAIKAVREGPEWTTNIALPKEYYADISAGTLPAVSWIVPDGENSDHPGYTSDTGPSWVGNVVNALGQSKYWDSSVIIVLWDDWGGLYDNAPPPLIDHWGGLGFRVPMMIVSPYDRKGTSSQGGYISHQDYEFGSILKFIEQVWDLGSLDTTDKRATSIADCFDFTQSPRAFTPIPTKYSRAYFLRQPPSDLPPDTY